MKYKKFKKTRENKHQELTKVTCLLRSASLSLASIASALDGELPFFASSNLLLILRGTLAGESAGEFVGNSMTTGSGHPLPIDSMDQPQLKSNFSENWIQLQRWRIERLFWEESEKRGWKTRFFCFQRKKSREESWTWSVSLLFWFLSFYVMYRDETMRRFMKERRAFVSLHIFIGSIFFRLWNKKRDISLDTPVDLYIHFFLQKIQLKGENVWQKNKCWIS